MTIHILLIEDDPDQLNALATLLEREGDYKVSSAENRSEGISKFQQLSTKLDLLITDMHLGSEDEKGGLELIKELGRRSQTYVPIIVLTAFGDMHNAAECMEAGAFSYVVKGNDTTNRILKETISRAIELRDERLEVDSMAMAICKVVDCHEPYTGGHCERVGAYARIIADKMGLSEEEKSIAWRAGLMHDLGKVGIDADVLSRPAKLPNVLMAAIREHPVEGYRILSEAKAHEGVAEAVRDHHRRIDGKGYPKHDSNGNLLGAISDVAQILGLADSFDAMTTPRPYLGGNGRDTFNKAFETLEGDSIEKVRDGNTFPASIDPKWVIPLKEALPEMWRIFEKHITLGKLPPELRTRNEAAPFPGMPDTSKQ